jgi:quercetin dioxygenase-like cupin family protein
MHPAITIGCVANLFSKMMHFKNAGDVELGHTHPFDHLTLLASGSLKVIANKKETIFSAPNMIYINKDVMHELIALEDNTVAYCIHALRDGNGVGDILDPAMIPNGVNPLSMADKIAN